MRDVWTSAGQQGPLPRDLPLLVRRRAGPGPTVTRLPLSGSRRAEELRGSRSRRGSCPGTGLCDPGAVRQVAALLSELLPISGAQNAGTVLNRAGFLGGILAWITRLGQAPPSERSSALRLRPAARCRWAQVAGGG